MNNQYKFFLLPPISRFFKSFFSLSKNDWTNKLNQRKRFDDIFKVLNLKNWEDWYMTKHYDILIQGFSINLLNLNY